MPSGSTSRTRRSRAGDACPACGQGTVYDKAPGVLVRITGQPPLAATVYQLQKLRCHLCGQVFTAAAPEEAGEQEVRRHGRQHDRAVEIRQRTAVQPPRRPAGGPGRPAAGLDPVGHRAGRRGEPRSGVRRVDPAGGAGRGAAQRRHHGQDPGADGGTRPARGPGRCRGRRERRRRAPGPVHLGRGRPARRPPGRAVLQRPPARGREPGPGAQAPRRAVAAADPDVRCPVAQPAGRAADDPGALPGPCPAAVRRRLRSLPRAVPPPARIAGRGLSQRRRGAGASAVARGPSAVPSGSERADDASTCTIG